MSERRDFLKSSAAGLLILKPETVFGSQANSTLELGLIGCGGRGIWIGNHFLEQSLSRFVAVHDPFADRAAGARDRFKVDASRVHTGLEGYKELIASKLDAIVIQSPVYFHPEQAAAAVAAGKHVYMPKPVAADVPGCLSIMQTGERAKGAVSFLVDFQTRAREAFQECARRVHSGAIGTPVMGHVYYHGGRLQSKAKPGMPPAEARLRDWVFDKVLSGDIIVEQHIHVLDVANWYMESHPLRAFGTGGRKARVDVGDCWDHFLVTFWYPNDVKVDFSSNQFVKGYSDLCIRYYGTAGTVDSHYGGAVRITGDNPWNGTEKDDTFTGGAITNIKAWVESIRTGKFLNNAQQAAESTLTSILGRTAAYAGRVVTWDEMMRRKERLEANLKL